MKTNTLFVSFLLLALAIRLAYVFLLPSMQTVSFRLEGLNDEASHLNYVHYLAQHHSFPVQRHHAREKDAFTTNEFEYYQAPLYYLVGATLESMVGKDNSLLMCRLLSFLFGILSLIVVWKIFSILPLPGTIPKAAVLFTALLPTHAYFCSVASNDSMSWFVSLLITLECMLLCTAAGSAKAKNPVVSGTFMGLLLGAGMLVKASLLLFVPIAFGLYAWKFFVRRDGRWLAALAIMLVIASICAGPWYARNLRVYGSPLAFGVGNGPSQFFLFEPHQFIRFVKLAVYCFWFPMQHVPPSHLVAAMLGVMAVVLLVNVGMLAAYLIRKRSVAQWEIALAILLLLNFAAYINYNLHWDNADGRFLFPSLAALLVLFCVPLEHFLRRVHRHNLLLPIVFAETLFPYLLLFLVR